MNIKSRAASGPGGGSQMTRHPTWGVSGLFLSVVTIHSTWHLKEGHTDSALTLAVVHSSLSQTSFCMWEGSMYFFLVLSCHLSGSNLDNWFTSSFLLNIPGCCQCISTHSTLKTGIRSIPNFSVCQTKHLQFFSSLLT